MTFESVDEILWCDRSNVTSIAVLLHGTNCFSIFSYRKKFGIFLNLKFGTLGSLKVVNSQPSTHPRNWVYNNDLQNRSDIMRKLHRFISLRIVSLVVTLKNISFVLFCNLNYQNGQTILIAIFIDGIGSGKT